MRKLLILGSTTIICDIVRAAQAMGVHTIVTDWNNPKDAPAKRIADEYWMLSLSDIDTIVDKIKEEGIGGVITGFSDTYLKYYIEICKGSGLPCYLTKDQLDLTLDKRLFKNTCSKFGIQTIPEFTVKGDSNLDELLSGELPILFKPVDNSGSRGVTKCETADRLKESFENAMKFSGKKDVLVEKFMDCEDISLAYTLRNGEVYLSAICDRYFKQTKGGGSVTTGLIYPSKYMERYLQGPDREVRRMLSELGFKNGVMFMQLFVDEKGFYFYEMGYRLSGGRHYLCTENQNGSSALKMLIEFALTGDMGETATKENAMFKDLCCLVSVICRSCIIGRMDGIPEIRAMKNVFDCSTYHNVGELVGAEGTTAQIVAKVHFSAKDMDELNKTLETIKDKLIIEDEHGKNIIYGFFNEKFEDNDNRCR